MQQPTKAQKTKVSEVPFPTLKQQEHQWKEEDPLQEGKGEQDKEKTRQGMAQVKSTQRPT